MSERAEALASLKTKKDEQDAVDSERHPAWKPGEGDILAGEMIRGGHVMTSNGDARFMVVEDDATGDKYTVWCSGKALMDFVLEKAPPAGSLVVIEFHGKVPLVSDPSKSFNKFSTICDSDPDFPYWDNISRAYYAKANASANTAEVQTFGPDESPF